MRFLLLTLLSLAACDACGTTTAPKVKATYGGRNCHELKCDNVGVCGCK